MSDILCIGVIVVDVFGKPVQEFPAWGTMAVFDQMEMHLGGCAANAACALSKMGIEAGIVCKVGRDGFGDYCAKRLKKTGVNCEGLCWTDKTSTSFSFIAINPSGDRCIFHTMGANAALAIDDIDMDLVKMSKIAFVAGSLILPSFEGKPAAEFFEKARALGLATAMDTVFNDRLENQLAVLGPCFPHLDYFLPSLEEAQRMTGLKDHRDIARLLKDKGCKTVAIKMGSQGSYILTDDEEMEIPAYKVNAVDTTGAGDSWAAGFLAGVLMGWPIEHCGLFGNAVAATCVQAVGCTTGVPTFEEVREFQRSQERS